MNLNRLSNKRRLIQRAPAPGIVVALLSLAALRSSPGYRDVQSDNRVSTASEHQSETRAGTDWWSLQPLIHQAPPPRSDIAWAQNAIDAFILQKLDERGLKPASPADRATLVRRANFDLLGLPPTPKEIDEFKTDQSPDAYAHLIDRLLASPHYGERWGRHWLDVVRFGESDGFENDKLREHAWHYRDYVINSLNADKPYDRFVKEQLAGDVLEPITRDGLLATGFLVAGPWDEIQFVAKSPTERLRAREEQQEELVATVGQTFLGLTVHCARCHDHKFDPIPQTDYYAIKAVFDGIDHRTGDTRIDNAERGNRPILTLAEQQAHEARIAPIQTRIKELTRSLDALRGRLGSDAASVSDDPKVVLTEGQFGQALNARRGHAEANAKPAFHSVPLTVECWVNVSSKAGFNIFVANHAKESSDHWELYTYAGSGEFSAFLPGYEPAEIKSGTDITDGRWHYVAMTFDGALVRLFVDARPARQVEVKRVRSGGPAGPLWFGAYPPQKIGCDGSVDEVRISNVQRVIETSPSGPFVRDQHTVGLWHMDALLGRRLADEAQPNDVAAREAARAEEESLRAKLRDAERELASHHLPLTYAGVRRQPPATLLYLRGDIQKPGPEVTAASPSVIRSASAGEFHLPGEAPEAQRRLRFAEWIASPDNPLPARVMVNRIWHYHFGHGLIETPSDFGFNGGHPSHAELLDWLASEFIACGFSVKHMHRLIMLSATYQQSSDLSARAAEIDSENRLFWRYSPRRLEAETVRDAMLAVSGEWNGQIGGPSFRPFTTTERNTQFYHRVDDDRPDFNRRTIYRINVNTAKDPLLDSLDCPAPSVTTPKRRSTTTTLQALALMNDSFVLRQAERFAKRLRGTAGTDPAAQVRDAFQIALGRDPAADEFAMMGALVANHGLESACWTLLNSSEFLHVR
jgi:hypothetical protein